MDDLVGVRNRVARHLVGPERELELMLSAVAAGRDIVLEGPPGTSKTTLLRVRHHRDVAPALSRVFAA